MREDVGNAVEGVVSELPTKSLIEARADNLKHANCFMDMFFDENL